MSKILNLIKQYIPVRFRTRRFMLDHYHFDLTSFEGDVGEWLGKFPITDHNVEIYFALAELFRRRGEFDKAVSVHEAIANAPIQGHSASEITLEIAQDYYAAGVLSHAEEVLVRALEDADEFVSMQAFRLWLAILESEQDWERAVALVEQYGIPGSGGLRHANLYCEYINQTRRQKPPATLSKIIRKALKQNVSARAEIMSAELSTEQNFLSEAISGYRELLIRDPRRVHLVLSPLKHLTSVTGTNEALIRFLTMLYKRHPSVRILEVLLELYALEAIDPPPETLLAVEQQVKNGDSFEVTQYWLKKLPANIRDNIRPLLPALKKHALESSDDHVCIECGFHSEKMLWFCPQCESWETLFSRYELKIDQQLKKVS